MAAVLAVLIGMIGGFVSSVIFYVLYDRFGIEAAFGLFALIDVGFFSLLSVTILC